MTTGRINQVARDEILTTPNKAWRRHESRHGNEETETSHSSRPKRSESEKGGHEMSRDRPKVPSQRVQRHRRHKARSADATRPLQERRIALLKGEGGWRQLQTPHTSQASTQGNTIARSAERIKTAKSDSQDKAGR